MGDGRPDAQGRRHPPHFRSLGIRARMDGQGAPRLLGLCLVPHPRPCGGATGTEAGTAGAPGRGRRLPGLRQRVGAGQLWRFLQEPAHLLLHRAHDVPAAAGGRQSGAPVGSGSGRPGRADACDRLPCLDGAQYADERHGPRGLSRRAHLWRSRGRHRRLPIPVACRVPRLCLQPGGSRGLSPARPRRFQPRLL